MIINNYFAISFLITLIINILNFETHQCNSTPRFFDYSYDIGIYNLKFLNGSLRCDEYHIHHWLIGSIILIIFELFQESIIKNIIQGSALSFIIDGLLFSDRFVFCKKIDN
jgi:hypothetical protein